MSTVTARTATAASRRTRRGTELVLVLFASALAAGLFLTVDAAQGVNTSVATMTYPIVLVVLALVAHSLVRAFASYADPIMLPVVVLLNGIGVAMIHRLDLAKAKNTGRPLASHFIAGLTGDAGLQVLWSTLAVVALGVVLIVVRDHRVLARYSYTLGFAALVLIALPAVLPARFSEINGARIWIRVGPLSVQPGEFAKIALMVFFAGYLVSKRDVLSMASRRVLGVDLPRGRDLGPVLVAWVASLMVLVFETDLGSSLLFFGIFIVMLYVATERTSWLLIGVLLFFGGAFAAWTQFGHVQERVAIWLHPFAHANTSGYQIVQALFGLATGGLFGTGAGSGRPDIVPYAQSDFIVSTIGEELGLFGLTAVLVLYAVLVERGLRTGLAVRDSFGKLLAGGLAFSIGLQVFVIVGGVSKLIPLTGLTTPFLSQGGSSLVANFVLVAVLLRVSDAARRPPAPQPRPQPLHSAPTEVVRL